MGKSALNKRREREEGVARTQQREDRVGRSESARGFAHARKDTYVAYKLPTRHASRGAVLPTTRRTPATAPFSRAIESRRRKKKKKKKTHKRKIWKVEACECPRFSSRQSRGLRVLESLVATTFSRRSESAVSYVGHRDGSLRMLTASRQSTRESIDVVSQMTRRRRPAAHTTTAYTWLSQTFAF